MDTKKPRTRTLYMTYKLKNDLIWFFGAKMKNVSEANRWGIKFGTSLPTTIFHFIRHFTEIFSKKKIKKLVKSWISVRVLLSLIL